MKNIYEKNLRRIILYISFIILSTILFTFSLQSIVNSITVETRENGEKIHYEVNTFNELYSIVEDFTIEYDDLLEENGSLERTIEELNDELEQKEEEISQLKEENSGYINRLHSNDDNWKLIIISIVIFGIPFLIYYIIDNKRTRLN